MKTQEFVYLLWMWFYIVTYVMLLLVTFNVKSHAKRTCSFVWKTFVCRVKFSKEVNATERINMSSIPLTCFKQGFGVSNDAKKTFHMNATHDFDAINFSSCSIWIFYCNWLNFSELIQSLETNCHYLITKNVFVAQVLQGHKDE